MGFLNFLGRVEKDVGNFAQSNYNPTTFVANKVVRPTLSFLGEGGKSVYDIGRGAVGSATGNKTAVANANKAKATDFPQFGGAIYRPVVQAAETIAHPFSQHTFTPTTPDQKEILGPTPIQNIQKGVATNYNQHANLNPVERIGLAAAYGGGQVVNDIASIGAVKAGGKILSKDAKAVVDNRAPLNEIGAIGKNVNEENSIHFPVGNSVLTVKLDELHKLTQAKTTADVKAIVGDALPDDVINRIAPAIVQTSDPHIVSNILQKGAESTIPKAPTISELGGARPQNDIQTAIEQAHNAGDNATVAKLIDQLPADSQPAMRSALGIEAPAPPAAPISDITPTRPTIQPGVDTGQTMNFLKPTEVDSNPFNDIIDAINGKGSSSGEGLQSLRKEQNELLSKERGQRFNKVGKSAETQFGEEGYIARRKALKGEYSKVEYDSLLSKLGPEKTGALFTDAQKKIYSTPDSVYTTDWAQNGLNKALHPTAAKFNTEVAVRKVLGLEPGLPTDSELRLLRVFSPKLADEVEAAIPKHRSLFDFASKLFGSIRGAKSTADLSMGGRQGLLVAARHPAIWAKANIESVKYAKSSDYYEKSMQEIADDPWVKAAGGRDIGLTGVHGHEEAFSDTSILEGKTAKKLLVGHVVAGSERAYTGGLTEMRRDLWKSRLQAYGRTPEEAAANLGSKGLDGLAEAVRTLTGRGGKAGGFIEKHATTLQEALFSPRLWGSRLQVFNPKYWSRIGPAGRAEAFQSLGAFAAVASVVLGAAAASGAEVETDPRSSDFLKIKVGDTRYDILGGFQQNLVFGARQALGTSNNLFGTDFNTTKSSQTGKMSKYGDGFGAPTQLSAVYDLVRNKANPILGSAANLIEGKDKAGNKINPLTEIGQLFVPISLQGAYQTIQHENSIPKGLIKNAPDILGFSTQTYGLKDIKLSDTQKAYIDNLKSNGASPEEVKAVTNFVQTLKTGPDKTATYKQIDAAIQAGNNQKAFELSNTYNKQLSDTIAPWNKQYGQYANNDLQKYYTGLKISREAVAQRIHNARNSKPKL